MAIIGLTIGAAVQFPGGHLIYGGVPAVAEAINTSGTSATSVGTVPAKIQPVITISVPDGAKVWVTFGPGTPVAAQGTTHLLGPGRHDFANVPAGWRVAAIDAV